MSPKTNRLTVIRTLVSQHQLGSQEELLDLLEKAGFELTQATLSRDLKLMKVIKAPNEKGQYVYTLPQMSNYEPVASEKSSEPNLTGYRSVEFSGNLAVVKTKPGHASAIAYEIDSRASHIILGTIAGDDTVLLVPREGFTRSEITTALKELFTI